MVAVAVHKRSSSKVGWGMSQMELPVETDPVADCLTWNHGHGSAPAAKAGTADLLAKKDPACDRASQ